MILILLFIAPKAPLTQNNSELLFENSAQNKKNIFFQSLTLFFGIICRGKRALRHSALKEFTIDYIFVTTLIFFEKDDNGEDWK